MAFRRIMIEKSNCKVQFWMQGAILDTHQTSVTVWIIFIQFNELFDRL